MARTSPVHYIAPSNINITANANSSPQDLAVFVAENAKISVYAPAAGLGTENATYREWKFAGRNRHLAESDKPYTIYARLSKTDSKDGYLVFAPKVLVSGVWKDKYQYVTEGGLASDTAGYSTGNYWYVRLGDVSLPELGERTVAFDTGILGTDQFNAEWNMDPDDSPMRVEITCTIDDKDAGPTPYVAWGKTLLLTAFLVEGWDSGIADRVDHWVITRNTGNAQADAEWNVSERARAFAQTGSMTLKHLRSDDDFAACVSTTFEVVAWGTDGTGDTTIKAVATARVTIMAETTERYELMRSVSIVSYSPMTEEYSPSTGVVLKVRSTDQRGRVAVLTKNILDSVGLTASYAVSGSPTWTALQFTGEGSAEAQAVIPVTAFSEMKDVIARLVNSEGAEVHRTTISFIYDDGEALYNFVTVIYNADKENLQNQIDGKFETWFKDYAPVATDAQGNPTSVVPRSVEPYSTWTTEAAKDEHVGDLFWDKSHEHAYRFCVTVSGSSKTYWWEHIGDSSIISVMAQAAKAQDTADGKRRVFTTQPVPPYDLGDLWAQGSTGDLMKCVRARSSGSFNADDWALACKYTDDTYAHTFDYLAAALQGDTDIQGGLVLSNLLVLRNLPGQGQEEGDIMSGINGILNTDIQDPLKSIASWYGGGMVDLENLSDYWSQSQINAWNALTPAQKASSVLVAKSLFRMNGSGYVAGGNITWDVDGNVIVSASRFYINGLEIFEVENAGTSAEPHYRVKCNFDFYSVGDVSALGASSGGGGGGGGGASTLDELNDVTISANLLDGQALVYDGEGRHWINKTIAQALASLTDVDLTGLSDGDSLVYDGNARQWKPGTGGVDMTAVWTALAAVDATKQISYSHLSGAVKINNGTITIGTDTITPFAYRGEVTDAYARGTSYSTLNNGMYYWQLSGSSASIIHFQGSGSASGLDLYFQYTQDANNPIYYRKCIDSNRFAAGYAYLIDSLNIGSQSVKNADTVDNYHASDFLLKSGGEMTGAITMKANQYSGNYALDMNNSDIVKVNSIYTADLSDNYGEGIQFKRTNGNYDSFRAADGKFYFGINNGASERIWIEPTAGSADMSLVLNGTQYRMEFMIGSGNVNRGIYGRTSGKWLLYFNASNTILNYGNVGIGTDSPSYKLHVGGTIYATGDVTAASDQRKKDFVEDAVLTAEQIAKAPAVKFTWKDKRDENVHAGTYAQYWQKVLPEVVTDQEDSLGLNYGAAAMVASINIAREVVDLKKTVKEQRKIIDEQQKIMEEQRRMLLEMKKEIELLKKGGAE